MEWTATPATLAAVTLEPEADKGIHLETKPAEAVPGRAGLQAILEPGTETEAGPVVCPTTAATAAAILELGIEGNLG